MLRINMKSKINVSRNTGTNDISKCRGIEASILIDTGSPINAGSLLNTGI